MNFNLQKTNNDLLDFAMIAASISNCEAALITLSDGQTIHVKASFGLENPKELIAYHEIETLLNATQDFTLEKNLKEVLIRDGKIVTNFCFYIGIPLKTKDQNCFGVLSLWNTEQVTIQELHINSLKALGLQIENILVPINQFQSLIIDEKEYYKNCLKDSKIGLWELDINTSEFKLNDVSINILGYKENDFRDFSFKTFLKIIYKDHVEESLSFLRQIKEKEIQEYQHHIRVRHKKGYWTWTTISAKVVKWNTKGKPEIIAGTMLDIHDFKTIQLQLESIIDNIECVAFRHIFFLDGSQEIVHITKGSKKLWGLTEEQVYDNFENVWNLVLEEDKASLKEILENSNATLEAWEAEWRINHPDGTIRWHKGQGQPVKNKNGSVSVDTVIIDITIHKSKKEELRLVNKKLNQAQEIASLGYWEFDLQKGTEYWSDNVYDIFGLERSTPLTPEETITNLIFDKDIPSVIEKRQNAINNNQEFFSENRIKQSDGSVKWIRQIGNFIKNEKNEAIFYEGTIQDITQSKLVSLALEDIIQRYNLVTKATSDAIWDMDVSNGKMYWGENYKKMFGHPTSGIAMDDLAFWESKIHPDDKQRTVDGFNNSIKLGKSNWEAEYRFLNIKNKYVNIIDKAFIVRNEKGVAVRMVGAMQDVTEKLQAIEDVKRSNERFEKVAEATNDGIWDWDLIQDIVFYGSGYSELFGYAKEEKNSKPDVWVSRIHPEDKPRILILVNTLISSKTEEYFNCEYRYLRNDGQYAYVVDRGSVIRNKSGDVIRIVGAVQDVTERVKYTAEIKTANERFEKVAEATNDAIWDWDLVNNSLYQGKGYQTLFGHDQFDTDITFEFWKKNVHPDDLVHAIASTEELLKQKKGTYFKSEYRYLRSDGNYANVIDRGSVIRNELGEVIRMVGAMQDVTESRNYEASLKKLNQDLSKQADELLSYNEELEQFAYVVSHDLQEPLRMISSFLILLEKKYNDVLDEEGKKYIYFAVDGAKRMRQIILDLLDFSRVGKTEEELITVDLNILIEEVILIFQQEIDEKKATFIIPEFPNIKSYTLLLQQIFQNLIGNALKYQKEDTKPIIELSYEELETHHKFSIIDNGIGIEPAYFDKIFVIFQRLHGRNQYNGTGIGLALVKKIIENLNGEIWVTSVIGKGTTFYFTIKK